MDTRLTLPIVDVDDWTLTIDGDVDRELTFTFDELLAMPLIERDITLTCVSNDVGGPYVGGARWLGVRLTDLLDQAGVGSTADQILSTDVDGITISTPLDLATDGRDAMVAIGMNGEALPREHGFPARMVVPGLYGFISATKWLTRLTLTTYAEQDAYWTERDWATDAPIKISSRIDTPKPFEDRRRRHVHRRRRLGPAPAGSPRSRCRSTAAPGSRPSSARRPATTTGGSGTSRGPPSPASTARGARHDQGRRRADPRQGLAVPRRLQRAAANHRPRAPVVEVRPIRTTTRSEHRISGHQRKAET